MWTHGTVSLGPASLRSSRGAGPPHGPPAMDRYGLPAMDRYAPPATEVRRSNAQGAPTRTPAHARTPAHTRAGPAHWAGSLHTTPRALEARCAPDAPHAPP